MEVQKRGLRSYKAEMGTIRPRKEGLEPIYGQTMDHGYVRFRSNIEHVHSKIRPESKL